MPNYNTVRSRVLLRILFFVLITVPSLAACGSGGGGGSATLTTYTITASAGSGGTVSPSGATTVTQGASKAYSITPNLGNIIATLLVDGVSVATSYNYTFTNVQANHTVSATFSVAPAINECNDGIDNDGDGLVDWQYDLGCEGPNGTSETAGSRASKNGFSTFDPDANSRIIYVSDSTGNDTNNGLTPATAVKTVAKGESLIRDGEYDFLLFKRGDTWTNQQIGRIYKGGRDAAHPRVIASYGSSTQRPLFRTNTYFLHDVYEKNYIAVLGLELYAYNVPVHDTGIRMLGCSTGFLVEDTKITYGELLFQTYQGTSCAGMYFTNVELRRNIVSYNYDERTCTSPYNSYRPSGTFASEVHMMNIEENFYDHNGWNDNVTGACATIYNHNFYLYSLQDLTMAGNMITRASSINIKTAAHNVNHEFSNPVFNNNFIYDGEIGISIGGGDAGNYRYYNMSMTNNVLSELGKENKTVCAVGPGCTVRGLSWGIDLDDDDVALIENNYLLAFKGTNSHGMQAVGHTERNVTIRTNTFYAIPSNGLRFDNNAWTAMAVANNRFLAPPSGSCLVDQATGFTGFTYTNNVYNYSANDFCVNGSHVSYASWLSSSGETGSSQYSGTLVDSTRTLTTYAASLGYADAAAFLAATKTLSRFNWQSALTAPAVNAYIKAGFAPN